MDSPCQEGIPVAPKHPVTSYNKLRCIIRSCYSSCGADGTYPGHGHEDRPQQQITRLNTNRDQPGLNKPPSLVGPATNIYQSQMKHFTVYTTAGCFSLVARTPAKAIASALKLADAKRHTSGFQVIACVQEHAFEKIAEMTEMTVDLSKEDLLKLEDPLTLCKEQPGRIEYLPTTFESYFEFIVRDANGCVQAQGNARTYALVLSEGQRYLLQYQQDGPHSLEVRRVDVLFPAGAAPTAHG